MLGFFLIFEEDFFRWFFCFVLAWVFLVRERVMEFDRRWLFVRPRTSWSPQTHPAWEGPARLWAARGLGSCACQAPLGIC